MTRRRSLRAQLLWWLLVPLGLLCLAGAAAAWFTVREEFSRPVLGSARRGTFSSLFALVTTPALLALFFVLLMAAAESPPARPASVGRPLARAG